MTPEELLAHCLAKPGAWTDYPWDGDGLQHAIPDDEICDAIDESDRLVVGKLAKKHRPDGWDEGDT